MEKCKPLNITNKKAINKIGNELILSRDAIKAENSHLKLNDIQILRLVLLGCLYANISNLTDTDIRIDKNAQISIFEVHTVVESRLGKGIVEKYTELPIKKLHQVKYGTAISHFKIIADMPKWTLLLPYSLEMLDYSEQDLECAWRDRRFGVITKKKNKVAYTILPPMSLSIWLIVA